MVSRRTRDFLLTISGLVLVLFALHVLGVGSPEPQAAEATQPEPFPERVVAKAAALPQFADGPFTRVRQRVDSLDAMWAGVFTAAGDRYQRPRLVVGAGEDGCGAAPSGGWAGLYCPRTRTLVIDLDGHSRRHHALGQGLSDLVLGYIVAHELGHHVQTLRGAPENRTLGGARRRELHAECLAGVWGRAAGIPLPPTWAYGESPIHGSVEEQIHWLNEGYRHGRPADCDAVWEDPAL